MDESVRIARATPCENSRGSGAEFDGPQKNTYPTAIPSLRSEGTSTSENAYWAEKLEKALETPLGLLPVNDCCMLRPSSVALLGRKLCCLGRPRSKACSSLVPTLKAREGRARGARHHRFGIVTTEAEHNAFGGSAAEGGHREGSAPCAKGQR